MRRRIHSLDHREKVEYRDARKKNKKNRHRLAWFIVGAVVLVVVGYLVALGSSFFKAANNVLANPVSIKDIVTKSTLKQTDGITNILILGRGGENHPGGQLTDTIILARINNNRKKVAMVSIPRDLQITFPDGSVNKINYAYVYGTDSEKNKDNKTAAGIASTESTVEKVTGAPIHYYVMVDFVGFKDIVDQLGGVTVDVEKDINDPYYPKDSFDENGNYHKTDAYQTFSLKAGEQKLDGTTALKYARSRETTSDFDRAKRQQNLLFAIKQKALSLGVLTNPTKVSGMLGALGAHIKTDLAIPELKDLFDLSKDMTVNDVTSKVISNDPKDGLLYDVNEGGYYLKPKAGDFTQIQQFVKNIFTGAESINSYSTPASVEVEIYNGSGRKGLGGKVADKLKAAGFTVTAIESNDEIIDKTVTYDGTAGSPALEELKKIVKPSTFKEYSSKGVIKVVLGKDYGN